MKNESNALKDKRNEIERDMKLGKLCMRDGNIQKVNLIYPQINKYLTYFCFRFIKIKFIIAFVSFMIYLYI